MDPTTLIDEMLLDIAASQRGMFTTAQAEQVGVDRRCLARLTTQGAVLHPERGLYAVAALVETGDEAWHRHLCVGAGLLHDDAVLTGVSAVLAHGLPVWGADLRRAVLLRPVDRSGSVACFWVRPAAARGRDVGTAVPTDWGLAMPVADALVQHALDAGTAPGVVSADAALHNGLVTLDQLTAAAQRVRFWPRAGRAAAMLELCDGRRESVGESRCGMQLAFLGIDVEPQVVIEDRGRFVARVDFQVKGTTVLMEFDGQMKYGSDPTALWEEKKREDALRRLGYTVVRVTWADLERPGAVAAKVRQALRDAGAAAGLRLSGAGSY